MKNKELELYKSLFRKVNLKREFYEVPEFMQPLTYIALIEDELMKEILFELNEIGEDIHLSAFKNYLLNKTKLEVIDINNEVESFKEVKYTTLGTLNKKLKLLEFICAIKIENKKIKLTTQGLSFNNNEYTVREDRVMNIDKLERITNARLIAKSDIFYETTNKEQKELNIYTYTKDGERSDYFVIIQANDRETWNKYKQKLEIIKFTATQEISNKDLNIDIGKYTELTISKVIEVTVKIEENIYNDRKEELEGIFEEITLTRLNGTTIVAKAKLKYKLEPFKSTNKVAKDTEN